MKKLTFDGRVALVTGAGRGIGREYALALAERGCSVVVNDLGASLTGEGTDSQPAEEVVREINAKGGDAVANFGSVTSYSEMTSAVDVALNHFGRIDILVNNAGNIVNRSFVDHTPDDFQKLLDIHYQGTLNTIRASWSHMQSEGYGRIVNVSSNSIFGSATMSGYGSVKAAVFALTRALAEEGRASGIQCNVVLPAGSTRMIPEGTPEDVKT